MSDSALSHESGTTWFVGASFGHTDDQSARFGSTGAEVQVVVDSQSAQLLEGATLDFKNTIDEQGFAITNPNASRSCGCGKSFS